MRIAIFMDFKEVTENMNREGIIVFLRNAIKAWLDYDKDLFVEFWCYPTDKKTIYRNMIDLFEGRRDRVSFYPKRVNKKDLCFCKDLRIGMVSIAQWMIHMVIPFTKYGKRMGERTVINREAFRKSRIVLSRIFNRESKADIIFLPFVELNGAIGANKPVVMQIHDLYTFLIRDLFMKELPYKMNLDQMDRELMHRMDLYTKQGAYFQTSSNFTLNEQVLKFVKCIKREHCAVIPFPPMVKKINEQEILSEKEFREKYNIGNYRYLAFPSQNRPGKNIITLLKAIYKINQKGWDLRLVTTGSMESANSTAKFVKKHKDIVIEIGHIPEEDLTALYKYSELVVCPNIIEGGLISDQAISALRIGGIPVIHGRSMGIEEVIERLGFNMETADLNWFNLFDVDELVKKMEEVLRDPQKTVEKQKVIAEAYKNQSWDDFAKRSLTFYNKVINEYKQR